MKNKYKKIESLILIFLLIFVPTVGSGCTNGTTDATYLVYYTNNSADNIIYRETVIDRQQMSDEELADTLLNEMFYSDVLEEEQYYSVKPQELEITELSISDNNVISMNFNSEYFNLSNVREIILRSAIVLTLIQINGIAGIEFFVDGEPITDSDGVRIGVMNAEQFVNVLLNEEGMLKQDTALTIYFADESGNYLKPTTYIFTIDNKNLSLEEYVVRAIVDGPTEEGYLRTVDPDVEILNVFTTEKICYVNLGDEFLNQNSTVSDDIMIYSIVNSLCALSYVSAVKFLVGGEPNIVLHMTYDLSLPITRDMTYTEDYGN